MKLVSLNCENCNAASELTVEDDITIAFCAHCGTKNLLDDGVQKIQHCIKKEDVARIKESETLLKIKEMEFAEKEKQRLADTEKSELRVGFLVIAIAAIAIVAAIGYIVSCVA
ncbi:MAG: hypothetical protein FWC70_12035 [Defluviitaleaceae bacterium]|nr:hypothetical protein [Defluviitaleaceae bacterium]